MDRDRLLAELEQLDIFKYVHPGHIEQVKSGLLDNVLQKQAFFFPFGENYTNINGRLFSFDAESLAEGGGLDLFNEVRPTLEKAGLNIENVDQVFNDNTGGRKPDYLFTLNNATCKLSSISIIPFMLWMKVSFKYLRFLNRILRKNKIKERFYLMNDASSDTCLAFLTPAQVKYIHLLKLNPRDRVYKPSYFNVLRPLFQIIGFIILIPFKKKVKE